MQLASDPVPVAVSVYVEAVLSCCTKTKKRAIRRRIPFSVSARKSVGIGIGRGSVGELFLIAIFKCQTQRHQVRLGRANAGFIDVVAVGGDRYGCQYSNNGNYDDLIQSM